MVLKLIKAAQEEPVTAEEVKSHLRIDSDFENQLIFSLIKTAREYAEVITRRSLATQSFELQLENFPEENEIILPKPPLISVDNISYMKRDGTEVLLETSQYISDTDSQPGRVVNVPGSTWPKFDAYPVGAVKIRYTAGYQSDLPQPIKQALLLLIGHFYENREASGEKTLYEIPFSVDVLLASYRIYRW